MGVPLCNALIEADASTPKNICIAPNRAEAKPAFLIKGDKAMAEAFGLIKP
ncbi:hypothetical protein D3C86_2167960 [compost metagenome]